MSSRFSRRQILFGGARLGLSLLAFEAGVKGLDLLDQHDTWAEASVSNAEFLAQHADRLSRLELGGSFAPEQWSTSDRGQRAALDGLNIAIEELNLRKLRLGFRWNAVQHRDGDIDLDRYSPFLERCLYDTEICLNVGPVRVFRWPEEHVPWHVLHHVELPPNGASTDARLAAGRRRILLPREDARTRSPAATATTWTAVRMLQVENEPFYPLGDHAWGFTPDYLETAAHIADDALPGRTLLVTSAGRLNLDSVRDVLDDLQAPPQKRFAGRLASGFDFHYRTPLRDSIPVVRYFDQISFGRPLSPTTDDNLTDSRNLGYSIEVTEGQMEPYEQFTQPGNSVRDLRYMLLRCMDHVLDPDRPSLLRIWGVEGLVQKMQRGRLTDEHRQIIELIQAINDRSEPQVEAQPR